MTATAPTIASGITHRRPVCADGGCFAAAPRGRVGLSDFAPSTGRPAMAHSSNYDSGQIYATD